MTDRAVASFRANIIVAIVVLAIVAGMTWWVLMIASDGGIHVYPGDRVCVAMLAEDGTVIPKAYYCGPAVFTEHDDFP